MQHKTINHRSQCKWMYFNTDKTSRLHTGLWVTLLGLYCHQVAVSWHVSTVYRSTYTDEFRIFCHGFEKSFIVSGFYSVTVHCLIQSVSFLYLVCSVHHGCRTAGLPLRPKLLAGQVLLRWLWHLLRWRVPDRLGLHAGYCWCHAHRLLALFCQICTEGAALPHPFAHAVIVHWIKVLFFSPPGRSL